MARREVSSAAATRPKRPSSVGEEGFSWQVPIIEDKGKFKASTAANRGFELPVGRLLKIDKANTANAAYD